jgi:hypothetical protein
MVLSYRKMLYVEKRLIQANLFQLEKIIHHCEELQSNPKFKQGTTEPKDLK